MNIVLAIAAAACAVAALVWARSVRMRHELEGELVQKYAEAADTKVDDPFFEARVDAALRLAKIGKRKAIHSSGLYVVLAAGLALWAVNDTGQVTSWFGALPLAFAVVSISWYGTLGNEMALARQQVSFEARTKEAKQQSEDAPKKWADRLAPDTLPDFDDFTVGRVYQAGSGLLAGDFFDVFRVSPTRIVAVIGDVSGKGIDSSITAFQAKYLLRVFLKQFRDPAQAVQELNVQMSATGHSEEFISLVVAVFDTEAKTLRWCSAGHPAAWVWHDREVQPLRSTGPLLMLAPESEYYSLEFKLVSGDMVVFYTDGLSEARRGDDLYGEDRIAALLRRDPTVTPAVLCKSLLEAARNFAEGPVEDDVAILAVKRI